MKKSLLAVAIAAALPAAASAQVTISGLLDFAYGNSSGFQSGSTISTRDFTSATSSIRFTAIEDLGGGMKATVQYDLDPRIWINNDSGIVRNESFLGLSGGFGNLRLGSPNSIGLTTFLVASPLGTGIGSGYGTDTADHSFVRHSRSLRYDSPSLGGLTLSFNYAPGGDRTSSLYPASTNTNGHHIAPTASEVRELGAAYSAGPLSVALAHITLPGQNLDGLQSTNAACSTGCATKSISHFMLAGRFTISATQLSAGWHSGDLMNGISIGNSVDGLRAQFTGSTTPLGNLRDLNKYNVEVDGFRLGIQHDVGAISLRGMYTKSSLSYTDPQFRFSRGRTEADWTNIGFRADYNFSKRTAAYFGFEQWKLPRDLAELNGVGANGAAATATNPRVIETTRTLTSVGMRHSF